MNNLISAINKKLGKKYLNEVMISHIAEPGLYKLCVNNKYIAGIVIGNVNLTISYHDHGNLKKKIFEMEDPRSFDPDDFIKFIKDLISGRI